MITGRDLRYAVEWEGIEDFESADFVAVLEYLRNEAFWVLGSSQAQAALSLALDIANEDLEEVV